MKRKDKEKPRTEKGKAERKPMTAKEVGECFKDRTPEEMLALFKKAAKEIEDVLSGKKEFTGKTKEAQWILAAYARAKEAEIREKRIKLREQEI